MGCRIGITTDLDERKKYWKTIHPTLRDWQVLEGPISTKDEAQRLETYLARRHGCESAPGGKDVPGKSWWVYGFKF